MIDAIELTKTQIDIVGASAGTGKTTRLATEFLRAVEGADTGEAIDPTRIIVCTFTNKAADELSARIRQRLLQAGKVEEAQLVLAGYVGTINSICGRLLKDYALESGLSPQQDVIPEQMAANLFAIASATVTDAFAQRIEEIARRLSFTNIDGKTKYQKRAHWMEHVRAICSFARANAMSHETLRESARRSWQGMQAFLGKADGRFDAEQLDELLESALEIAINKIDTSVDLTEVTAKALQNLRECFARSRDKGMTWRDWASIKKLSVGAGSKAAVEHLLAAGNILHLHPQLHSDIEEYLTEIFECAIACLDAYQNYKNANGLLDFVDQEYLALKLLDNETVRESLRSRLDLVLIDEFQDTSPIQLSLFLKLAELSKRSIWVGDVKQAIYGFRGTDPQLMQDAARQFNRMPPLEASFRSRPELVHFSNELFRRVFPDYGIEQEDVLIRPSGNRTESERPSLETWDCEGDELNKCVKSLAIGVKELLSDIDRRIDDPESGKSRATRGSDIAILCRKNDHCAQVAGALSELGLKVAMVREGLLDTPECLLIMATLRYLVDDSDKVALGQIVHLSHDYRKGNQSAWLSKWLASGRNPETLLKNNEQFLAARKYLPGCTVDDALNLSIELSNVLELIYGWGSVPERLSNIDAVQGLVIDYESTCSIAKKPATIAGFLNYAMQLEESNQPASTDLDAVQVMTYHAAKGLEWPVVILSDLDSETKPKVHKDLCRVYVESSGETFDVKEPLKERWIRFWPWPFGSVEKDGEFESNAASSAEFAATENRVRAENLRLMYVGVTRARDLLIFAPYAGRSSQNPNGTQWLDELASDGSPTLSFPKTLGPGAVTIGNTSHPMYLHAFNSSRFSTSTPENSSLSNSFAPTRPASVTGLGDQTSFQEGSVPLPYRLRPSNLSSSQDLGDITTELIEIGERIPVKGTADMAKLGECVHSFLAIDSIHSEQIVRQQTAAEMLKRWHITQIDSSDLLLMSDRLDQFLDSHFGAHSRITECTVTARIGKQRLHGAIDLLVETSDAFHIIDHKSFPGSFDQWVKKAESFIPQIYSYKQAIEQAQSKSVGQLLLHMPVLGRVMVMKK